MSEDPPLTRPCGLLRRLVELFPEFEKQWETPDNCFKNDDGSYTYCGVFSEFSSFVCDGYGSFALSSLDGLGKVLSECMAEPNSGLDEAAATCFLENVAYESFSPSLAKHLSGAPLNYFSQFLD